MFHHQSPYHNLNKYYNEFQRVNNNFQRKVPYNQSLLNQQNPHVDGMHKLENTLNQFI